MWHRLWDLDWSSAQALYGLMLAPVLVTFIRAFRAKSALEIQYRDHRSMAQADIASQHIYPLLAKLVASLPPPPSIFKSRPWQPGDEVEIENHLQAVSLGRQVTEMAPFFADSADCLRCQHAVRKAMWGQAWGLIIYFPGALFICWALLQRSYSPPSDAYWAAACVCSSGLTAFAIFLVIEIMKRNRLASLSMDEA